MQKEPIENSYKEMGLYSIVLKNELLWLEVFLSLWNHLAIKMHLIGWMDEWLT